DASEKSAARNGGDVGSDARSGGHGGSSSAGQTNGETLGARFGPVNDFARGRTSPTALQPDSRGSIFPSFDDPRTVSSARRCAHGSPEAPTSQPQVRGGPPEVEAPRVVEDEVRAPIRATQGGPAQGRAEARRGTAAHGDLEAPHHDFA